MTSYLYDAYNKTSSLLTGAYNRLPAWNKNSSPSVTTIASDSLKVIDVLKNAMQELQTSQKELKEMRQDYNWLSKHVVNLQGKALLAGGFELEKIREEILLSKELASEYLKDMHKEIANIETLTEKVKLASQKAP